MASTPTTYTNGKAQFLQNDEETLNSTPIFRPATRRTPSFSSLSPSNSWDSSFGSSLFSYNDEFPPFTPTTPLKFKGKIPFSWEKIPGIPKQQSSKKKEYPGGHLLPLPPTGSSNSSTKKLLHHQEEISPKKSYTSNKFQKDPFLAALVECSKDDDHDHDGNIWKASSKITRTLSDRFGLINMYMTSCKRTCTVTESIVYHPRQSPHYVLNRRSSSS